MERETETITEEDVGSAEILKVTGPVPCPNCGQPGLRNPNGSVSCEDCGEVKPK